MRRCEVLHCRKAGNSYTVIVNKYLGYSIKQDHPGYDEVPLSLRLIRDDLVIKTFLVVNSTIE